MEPLSDGTQQETGRPGIPPHVPPFAPGVHPHGFERIYRKHAADVYRYALAVLHNPSDAEDVAQTTFLNAYRAYQRGEQPVAAKHWLIAIAHNVCRQRFRQSQRRPHEVEFNEDIAEAPLRDPEYSAADIRRALGQLSFNQRSALVMRELEGRSYADIAELLGLSVSAVETLLFRARRALREQLEAAMTCDQAELALSRQRDGLLSRADKSQLRAHLRSCAECATLARSQRAQRSAWKALGAIPLPSSLTGLFGGGTAIGTGLAVKAAAVAATSVVVAGGTYGIVESRASSSTERRTLPFVPASPETSRERPAAAADGASTSQQTAPAPAAAARGAAPPARATRAAPAERVVQRPATTSTATKGAPARTTPVNAAPAGGDAPTVATAPETATTAQAPVPSPEQTTSTKTARAAAKPAAPHEPRTAKRPKQDEAAAPTPTGKKEVRADGDADAPGKAKGHEKQGDKGATDGDGQGQGEGQGKEQGQGQGQGRREGTGQGPDQAPADDQPPGQGKAKDKDGDSGQGSLVPPVEPPEAPGVDTPKLPDPGVPPIAPPGQDNGGGEGGNDKDKGKDGASGKDGKSGFSLVLGLLGA